MSQNIRINRTFAYIGDKILLAIMLALVVASINYYANERQALNAVTIADTDKAMEKFDLLVKASANYRAKLKQINNYQRTPGNLKQIKLLKDESNKLLSKYSAILDECKLSLHHSITSDMNMYVQLSKMYYDTENQIMYDEMSKENRDGITKNYKDINNILELIENKLNRQNIRSIIMATQYH